jgi:hypothetical protein
MVAPLRRAFPDSRRCRRSSTGSCRFHLIATILVLSVAAQLSGAGASFLDLVIHTNAAAPHDADDDGVTNRQQLDLIRHELSEQKELEALAVLAHNGEALRWLLAAAEAAIAAGQDDAARHGGAAVLLLREAVRVHDSSASRLQKEAGHSSGDSLSGDGADRGTSQHAIARAQPAHQHRWTAGDLGLAEGDEDQEGATLVTSEREPAGEAADAGAAVAGTSEAQATGATEAVGSVERQEADALATDTTFGPEGPDVRRHLGAAAAAAGQDATDGENGASERAPCQGVVALLAAKAWSGQMPPNRVCSHDAILPA